MSKEKEQEGFLFSIVGCLHNMRALYRNMDPYLLQEIHDAHDATVDACVRLEDILETINPNDVSIEYSKILAEGVEGAVEAAIEAGRIPIDTMETLEEGALSVFIQNTMNSIAESFDGLADMTREGIYANTKMMMVTNLTSALGIAREIEQAWADIIPIAEMQIAEGLPNNNSAQSNTSTQSNSSTESNTSTQSNNEFSGGYKKRTLRKKRHAKRTEKRHAKRTEKRHAKSHAKRHAKRTLRKRSEKRTAKRCKKRTSKHREKRTKKRRYF